MDFTSCSLFERILNLICFQIGHVAASNRRVSIRRDHEYGPLDLKRSGWPGFAHTLSVK
jgi:hypothetical protein